MKQDYTGRNRHPLDIMLSKSKISARATCKLMRISEQTFVKLKHCYVNTVSNSKLMVLASVLGVQLWELIYILERHRQLTSSDNEHMNKSIKRLNKAYNFPPL